MDRQVKVSLLSGEYLALHRLAITDGSTISGLIRQIVLRQLRQNGRSSDSARVPPERDRDELIRFDRTVHVLLSSESYAQVRNVATEEDTCVSAVIRRMVRRFLHILQDRQRMAARPTQPNQ